jgi:hypothetical protein
MPRATESTAQHDDSVFLVESRVAALADKFATEPRKSDPLHTAERLQQARDRDIAR